VILAEAQLMPAPTILPPVTLMRLTLALAMLARTVPRCRAGA
jgi:hypothetical protein